MSFKEIAELRKNNRLNEAWRMAHEWKRLEPGNIWATRALGWVLFDFLKTKIGKPDSRAVLKVMNQITQLQIPSEESMLVEQIDWQLAILLKKLKLNKTFSASFAERLMPLLLSVPSIDSKGHRALLNVTMGIPDMPNRSSFMSWWGWHHFTGTDIFPERGDEPNPPMALAEQVFIHCAKEVMQRVLEPPGPGVEEEINGLVTAGRSLLDKNTQLNFVRYHLSFLLNALNKKGEALEAFLPFAQKKPDEFWIWNQLSNLLDDADSQLLCLVKAVSCKAPAEFKVKVRERLAMHLLKHEYYIQAKQEVDEIIKQRELNGWRLTTSVVTWQHSQWYKHSKTSGGKMLDFKVAAQEAQALLFGEVSSTLIVIDRVLESGWVWFVMPDYKMAKARSPHFLNDLKAGTMLSARIAQLNSHVNHRGETTEVYRILSAAVSEEAPSESVKHVSGELLIPPGKLFGILDGAFVPSYLIKEAALTNGQTYKGRAIRNLNPKNNQLSWKVVHVMP